MLLKTIAAAALGLTLALPANMAQAAEITFDELGASAGNILKTKFRRLGVTLRERNGHKLALYDTNCGVNFPGKACSGNDDDLATGPSYGTEPQGLVLIVEENPKDRVPDDRAKGGTIFFDFAKPVSFENITLLDADPTSTGVHFDFYLADGSVLKNVQPWSVKLLGNQRRDNSMRQLNFGIQNVKRVSYTSRRSGAVAGIEFFPSSNAPSS